MSYVSAFGDDVATTPAPAAPAAPSTVADRTPPFTQQTLQLMGVTAIPWAPVALGSWLGSKTDVDHGGVWGALAGFTVSFLAIRTIMKKNAGTIT